ncbi:MAG: hypothetical protein FD144_5594 [Rhodospirillaceae bacterium]|nr:MAG: hypothetical protein FD144_5594 [Rhodospirillaceae bacterium]
MSVMFDCLPNAMDSGARDLLDRDASLIRRAFDLAAKQPYGFTFDDLEHVEAYRTQPAADVTSLECVASLTDGRRFHLAHVAGPHRPDFVTVTQMMTTEPLPSGRSRFWIDDVAELNHRLGLPLIPPPPTPVILPLPARH